jgi:SAM-dependent methyltransferase
MRKSELYYEELGDDFDRFMSEYDVERRAALIATLFPSTVEGPALEVGCGTGAITRSYRHLVEHLTVTDISERLALRVAAQVDAVGKAADATRLPFEDGSFGLVISSECVEHTPDPARAVGEMLRVLVPGGHLVLTTPNRLWLPVVLAAQRFRLRRFQGNEDFLGVRELRSAVSAAGGTVLRHSGCHLFPWQVPGAKPLLRRLDRFGPTLHRLMINQGVLARRLSANR